MPILLLLAVALTPSARVQREAEDRARGEVADLLRSLCPEQCVLLSVEARVEDDEVTRAEPGFDPPGEAVAPVLRKVTASLVVDGKLAPAFRAKVKDLVAQRLRVLGVPGEVATQSMQKAAYLRSKLRGMSGVTLPFGNSIYNEFVVRTPYLATDILMDLEHEKILGGIPLGQFYPEHPNDFLVAVTELHTREHLDRFADKLSAAIARERR